MDDSKTAFGYNGCRRIKFWEVGMFQEEKMYCIEIKRIGRYAADNFCAEFAVNQLLPVSWYRDIDSEGLCYTGENGNMGDCSFWHSEIQI